jgi:hypothetical protein
MALPDTRNTQRSPDHPDVGAHIHTRPDSRKQRPPRGTSEVQTHRAFDPRTLARLDA